MDQMNFQISYLCSFELDDFCFCLSFSLSSLFLALSSWISFWSFWTSTAFSFSSCTPYIKQRVALTFQLTIFIQYAIIKVNKASKSCYSQCLIMKPSEFHGMLMDRFCIKNTNQKCHNSKNVCYDNNCSTSRSKSLFVSGKWWA